MNLPHMLDHLVFPRESVIALAMTTWFLAIDELSIVSIVHRINMPLQIRLPRERLALTGAWLVEAEVLWTVRDT